MFGLMHFNGCQKTDEELYRRRLLYCGTCKAIGSSYGQSARMLLNNDVVFLGEILQAISKETSAKIENWAPAFQSYNCLSLPNEADIPVALRIAAAVSMILSELKLEDHIDDSGSVVYRGAKKCLDPVFTKSESEFSRLSFPMDEIRKWFDQQSIRERLGRGSATEDDALSNFAEPTAMITALVFEHSASIVSGDRWKTTMHRLGYNFGALIYLIDAFEDYAKDFRSTSFNAIANAFDLNSRSLPAEIEKRIKQKIEKIVQDLDLSFEDLPITSEQKQEYSQRLWRNVRRKTGFNLHHKPMAKHVHVKSCETRTSNNRSSCSRTDNGLKSRWQTACATASNLTADMLPTCDPKFIHVIHLTYRATVYLFVLLIAFLSPVQSRSVRSYRECVELPFNLMFWGAAIATIINSFVQIGNKSFAYAHAMVGGGSENDRAYKAFSDPSPERLATGSSDDSPEEEQQNEPSDPNEDDGNAPPRRRQKGINNDQSRKNRTMYTSNSTPCCLCCDCSGGCCEGGGDCCCESSECCCDIEAIDCCTGCECCAGGCDCCTSSGGSLECCAGTDCCAGGCECCTGGGECCGGGLDCCAGGDCCSGGCECCAGGDCCSGGCECCAGCFN